MTTDTESTELEAPQETWFTAEEAKGAGFVDLSGGSPGVALSTGEVFNDAQVANAIWQFLQYGENSFVPADLPKRNGHHGYFSGEGWAARCLRFHLARLDST